MVAKGRKESNEEEESKWESGSSLGRTRLREGWKPAGEKGEKGEGVEGSKGERDTGRSDREGRSERRHNACGPPRAGRRAGRDQDDDSILSKTSGSIDQWRDRCLLGPDRSSTWHARAHKYFSPCRRRSRASEPLQELVYRRRYPLFFFSLPPFLFRRNFGRNVGCRSR